MAVVATVVLTRILIPREFGRLALMQYLVTFLAGLAGAGLSLAVTRQVAATRTQDPLAAGRYVGVTIVLTVLGTLVVLAVCVLLPRLVSELLGQGRGLAGLIPITAVGAATTAIGLAAQSALIGLEAFSVIACTQIVQALATAIGMIAGAQLAGTRGALVGLAVGQGVATVLTLLWLDRRARALGVSIQYGLHREEARRLWRIGIPAFIAFLAASVALLFGQTFLSQSAGGYARLAEFNVALRWHLGILFLPTSALPMLLPMMTRYRSERRPEAVRRMFRITMRATIVVAAVPALAVAVLSGPLLSLSGSFYAHHRGPLIVLALAAIPASANNVLSNASISVGAIRAWLVSDLVLAATLVGVTLLLVNSNGAIGLSAAYLAAFVATDLVLVRPLRRAMGSGLRGGEA